MGETRATGSAARAAFAALLFVCACVHALEPTGFASFERGATEAPGSVEWSGVLELVDALPDFELLDANAPEVEMMQYFLRASPELLFRLDFALFPGGRPGLRLRSGMHVAVEGVAGAPPPHPDAPRAIIVSALGVRDDGTGAVEPPSEAIYTPVELNSLVYDPLFVLLNFNDGNSVCTRDSLDSLVYSGTRNIRDLYVQFSNDRATLARDPHSGASTTDYRAYRIAGPYNATDFSINQNCDDMFQTWVTRARQLAFNGGWQLQRFSSIIVVTPRPASCAWAGRASLSNCRPNGGSNSQTLPSCMGVMLRCEQFVFSHEMGHNMDLEHSAITNPTTTSHFYRDWSCLMGNRNDWNKLNAVKLLSKGWIDASRVVELNTSWFGEVWLQSLDFYRPASPLPQVAFALDTTSPVETYYYFSVRSPEQLYSSGMPTEYQAGVNVHTYDRVSRDYSYYNGTLANARVLVLPTLRLRVRQGFKNLTHASIYVIPPQCDSNATCPFVYEYSAFSPCNGCPGVTTRNVTCRSNFGSGPEVALGNCIYWGPPVTQQACNMSVCANVTVEWATGAWGDCSVMCGSGTQTRSVSCRNRTTLASVSTTECEAQLGAASRPQATQSCTQPACPSFVWFTGPYSTCSATCGGGSMTRVVECRNGAGAAVADSNCAALGPKPSNTAPCGTAACPLTYYWLTGAWSTCSASCGGGVATRPVQCRENGSDTAVAETLCANLSRPADSQMCNNFTCTACDGWTCNARGACRASCSASGCVPQCECEPGWAGANCTVAPTISDVTLAAVAGAGGATHRITWRSTGGVAAVSVALRRGGGAPLEVARNVSNTPGATRTLNFNGAGLVLALANYTAEVSFSSAVRNSSAAAELDPCVLPGFCLNGGNCVRGVCSCVAPFAGARCENDTTPAQPCLSVQCLNGGECEPETGACRCNETIDMRFGQAFGGPFCDVPPGCPLRCENSGAVDFNCTHCDCPLGGPWGGERCEMCGRNGFCLAGGAPSAACDACVCARGRDGTWCELMFLRVAIGPFEFAADALPSPASPEWAVFAAAVQRDVADAIGVSLMRVRVESAAAEVGGVTVRLRLHSIPPSGFAPPAVYQYSPANPVPPSPAVSAPRLQTVDRTRYSLMDPDSELAYRVALLLDQLADPASPFYRGVVTARLNPTTARAQVSSDGDGGSASSSSQLPLLIGVGAAAAVVAIVVIAVLVVRHRRSRADAKRHEAKMRPQVLEVGRAEPAAPPRQHVRHMRSGAPPTLEGETGEAEPGAPTVFAAPAAAARPVPLPLPRAAPVAPPRVASAQLQRTPTTQPQPQRAVAAMTPQQEWQAKRANRTGAPSVTTAAAAAAARPPPPVPPPRPPRLPPNWEQYETEDGIKYYFNKVTQQSVWEFPTQ